MRGLASRGRACRCWRIQTRSKVSWSKKQQSSYIFLTRRSSPRSVQHKTHNSRHRHSLLPLLLHDHPNQPPLPRRQQLRRFRDRLYRAARDTVPHSKRRHNGSSEYRTTPGHRHFTASNRCFEAPQHASHQLRSNIPRRILRSLPPPECVPRVRDQGQLCQRRLEQR